MVHFKWHVIRIINVFDGLDFEMPANYDFFCLTTSSTSTSKWHAYLINTLTILQTNNKKKHLLHKTSVFCPILDTLYLEIAISHRDNKTFSTELYVCK